jgi:hypothetical protein
MFEKVPMVAALQGRLCLVAKSSFRPVWMGWLAPYPYLGPTVIRIRGQDALPGFVLSHRVRMVSGALLVRYPWPWMLVEVLTAFIPIYRLLHGACALLPEGHLPYVGSVMACIRISLIELLSRLIMRRVPAPEYMLSGMHALSFVR